MACRFGQYNLIYLVPVSWLTFLVSLLQHYVKFLLLALNLLGDYDFLMTFQNNRITNCKITAYRKIICQKQTVDMTKCPAILGSRQRRDVFYVFFLNCPLCHSPDRIMSSLVQGGAGLERRANGKCIIKGKKIKLFYRKSP